ncbi:MAG: diguanylate cyclase [Rhodanobacter sp.]
MQPVLQLARLPDAKPSPTAAAITDGSMDGSFQPLQSLQLAPSSERDRWYRLKLAADWNAAAPPVLSFHDTPEGTPRAYVWVYAPPSYRPQRLAALQRDVAAHHSIAGVVAILPQDLGKRQMIYVRLERSDFGKQITPSLTDLTAYRAAVLDHVRLVTMFVSVQGAMILVGLFAWLTLRDRLFRYFIAYLSAEVIYTLLDSGEIHGLPGGAVFASIGASANWLFALLTAGFAVSFVIEFCNLRHTTPRAALAFGLLRWPLFAAVPVCLLLPVDSLPVLHDGLNLLLLITAIMTIAVIMLTVQAGNRQARYFLIAWMPQVALTVVRLIQLMAGWPEPRWLEYGLPFSMAFASLVITLGIADQTLYARRERDVADELAHHDDLTGAFNRRAVLSRLDEAVLGARREKHPLALLFLDLDHFKTLNDTHGHAAGDRCLQGIVQALSHELRADDWLGRYGGEEFVIVLPGATRQSAEQIGERMRSRVESLELLANGHALQITISVGVAGLLDQHDTAAALIERADAALYCAKSAGRNRLAIHPSLTTPSSA